MMYKKLFILIGILAILGLATPAFADTMIFYPDVDGVDGRIIIDANLNWTGIRNGAGTDVDYISSVHRAFRLIGSSQINIWNNQQRAIFIFDTSALPDTAIITSATFSLYGNSKADDINATPALVLREYIGNSTTILFPSDYNIGNHGIIRFANDISFNSLSITGYNDMSLNSFGLNAISKTGLTKFSTTADNDFDNLEPSWGDSIGYIFDVYFSEAGISNSPKLVVNYTITPPPPPPPPPASASLNLGFTTASSSDLLASVGALFIDLWAIIALMIGIPLAFYIIQRVIKITPQPKKGR